MLWKTQNPEPGAQHLGASASNSSPLPSWALPKLKLSALTMGPSTLTPTLPSENNGPTCVPCTSHCCPPSDCSFPALPHHVQTHTRGSGLRDGGTEGKNHTRRLRKQKDTVVTGGREIPEQQAACTSGNRPHRTPSPLCSVSLPSGNAAAKLFEAKSSL